MRAGLNVDHPTLTELGPLPALRLAARLVGEHFDEILVSPLTRADQTSQPLLERLGREPTVAPWLEEIRNPVWHGTPVERAEEAFRAERARPAHHRWEGLDRGEPVRDFVERVHRDMQLFLAERGIAPAREDLPVWRIAEPGSKILLIAHAGTNAVAFGHLLGLQPVPWEWERFVLGHASVSRVESLATGDGHTFSLTKLGDVEHLDAAERTR